MTYLVDSNAWILHLRKRATPLLSLRLTEIPASEIVICTVVQAELLAGAYRSRDSASDLTVLRSLFSLFPSLSFDEKAADAFGRVRAELDRQGTPIGSNDLMIASIALAHDLTVVTHNTSEFVRIPNLQVEDWQ